MEVESAIPPSLQQERTVPANLPKDYTPPVAAYMARFPSHIKDIAMAVFGVQHRNDPREPSHSSSALSKLVDFAQNSESVSEPNRPRYWETAYCTDVAGSHTEVLICYWPSQSEYASWLMESGFAAWWDELDPQTEPNGWFKEVFLPPVERFETVFSHDNHDEGVSYMKEKMSGPIREHVYWGSMRDRLPISQTDRLTNDDNTSDTVADSPNKKDKTSNDRIENSTTKQRIKLSGVKNLAIIRSGQDWSLTTPHERTMYLETIHPALTTGMNFLRDQGDQVGCFSNRFMTVSNSSVSHHHHHHQKGEEGEKGEKGQRTFGLSFFHNLTCLESWSRSHRTHLDIFGRFMKYAGDLQGNVTLRLYHEVLVLDVGRQQQFEYVGCHARTGMLAFLFP